MDAFLKLVTPAGRIGRREFLTAMLVHVVVLNGLGLGPWLASLITGLGMRAPAPIALALSALDLWLVAMLFVRRAHDVDKPGTWLVPMFVPVVGPFYFLYCLIVLVARPGTPGANRFGPPAGSSALLDDLRDVARRLGERMQAAAAEAAREAARARTKPAAGPSIGSPAQWLPTPPAIRAWEPAPATRSTAERPPKPKAPPPRRPSAPVTQPETSVVVWRRRRGLFG